MFTGVYLWLLFQPRLGTRLAGTDTGGEVAGEGDELAQVAAQNPLRDYVKINRFGQLFAKKDTQYATFHSWVGLRPMAQTHLAQEGIGP